MANVGWKYTKPQRPKDYVPLYLSDDDSTVPPSAIKLTTLLTSRRYGICMLEKECLRLRKESFENVEVIYKRFNSPSFTDLWNYNIQAISENGFNEFYKSKKVRPIANLIRCYEKEQIVSQKRGFANRKVISFGVDKKELNEYKAKQLRAERLGLTLRPPVLKMKKKKTKEQTIFGDNTVVVDEHGTVSIAKNALYNRFSHWCDLEGITVEQGVLMALRNLIRDYPNSELGCVENYQVPTPIDKKIFVKPELVSKVEEKVIFSEMIIDEAERIIFHYNSDPQNKDKKEIDTDTYINNALHLMNSKMPLKYRDTELYNEYMETMKMEAENQSIIAEIKREEKIRDD